MGYTTKEFCRICNVGRETLRYYEQIGFLQPEINPDNHYRSYDGWDAGVIADIKRYQSIGFSLDQIKAIFSEYNLADLIASVEDRVTIYQNQIQYYQMLCKKMRRSWTFCGVFHSYQVHLRTQSCHLFAIYRIKL